MRNRVHKKNHPLLDTETIRAMTLIELICKPEKCFGAYDPRRHVGHAFWYNQRHGKVRSIKGGQWAGPWRAVSPDGLDPI